MGWYLRMAMVPALSQVLIWTMTDWLLLYKHSGLFCINVAIAAFCLKIKQGHWDLFTTVEGWTINANFIIILFCVFLSQCLLCMTQQLHNGRSILSKEDLSVKMTELYNEEMAKQAENHKIIEQHKREQKLADRDKTPKEYNKKKKKKL